jgi:hypothetical protein
MSAFVQRYIHASFVFKQIIEALEMEVNAATAKIAERR